VSRARVTWTPPAQIRPHKIKYNAEKQLIGYALVHGRRAFVLLDRGLLTPDHFHEQRNRDVWRAIQTLYCTGQKVDTEAVALELGYTTIDDDGQTWADVIRLYDYLCWRKPPNGEDYSDHPDLLPWTDDDFIHAAEKLSGVETDTGQ
jgi:hypothetical protein